MILKKPYAFFIKHFKLIHLIMLVFLGLLLYQSNIVREFFADYLSKTPMTITKGTAATMFPSYMYIWFAVSIIGSAIILVVMNKKEKPAVFYAVNIVSNVALFVFMIYSRMIVLKLETELLDQRILRGIRDINNIIIIFQIVVFLITLVRAIGFDIKKFNFVKDLQELDIDVKDNEEFEVALEFDLNDYKRKFKKWVREFKYFFLENVRIIIACLVILFISVFLFVYLNFWKFSKTYKLNEYFNTSQFNIMVNNAYTTSNNYKLSNITSNKLLIVSLNVKDCYDTLNSSRTLLKIGNDTYYPISSKYNEGLIDIGAVYNNETLSGEEKTFMLVYEIPKNIENKKVVFTYLGNSSRTLFGEKYEELYVNLTPENLDDDSMLVASSIEKELTFDSTLIKGKLFVNNYEIKDLFVSTYNKCIAKNECYNFNEYLQSSFTGYQDKTILRMNYTLTYNNGSNISDSLNSLISKYGKISYVLNDKVYYTTDITATSFKLVETKSNVYLEVPKVIEDATKIELVFNIRDTEYRYVLKGV